MKDNLVSVIIPVYNAEEYVRDAVESICRQTYPNLEIIIIDDGSTDKSLEILRSIQDPRIKLVSRENKGLIATLNEGVTLSSGQYIARMDADDICYPERIFEQIEFYNKNPSIGVLFTGIECIDSKGNVFKKNFKSRYHKVDPTELLFGCPVCHPTAIFNMKALAKEDIVYDSNFKNTEDYELWTRLISRFEVGVLGKVLFKYRVHEKSITSSSNSFQRKKAVEALAKNLISAKFKNNKDKFFIVYNNHQGNHALSQTVYAIFFLFIFLKRINAKFSYTTYIIKAYRLIERITFKRKEMKLR